MQEVVEAINRLQTPYWLMYMQAFSPFVLSVVVIYQNYKYKKDNENLQKQIHNMTTKIALHDKVLTIYQVFIEGADLFTPVDLHYLQFLDNNAYKDHIKKLILHRYKAINAYNHANMLMKNDPVLQNIIKELYEKSTEIINSYLPYLFSIDINDAKKAWSKVIEKYPDVQPQNPISLINNNEAYELFKSICETEAQKAISEKVKSYKDLLDDKKFDIYFEKYLTLKEID